MVEPVFVVVAGVVAKVGGDGARKSKDVAWQSIRPTVARPLRRPFASASRRLLENVS